MANERHSYVEFYPSDWTAGTAYMPASAEWLYLQVCLFNWDKREPLPISQATLRFSRSPTWADDLTMLLEVGKVIKTASGGLFVERAIFAANKAYDLWSRKSKGGKSRAEQIRQAADEQGQSESDCRSPASTTPNSPPANQNQNQNQNQTLLSGESPPSPPIQENLLFSIAPETLKAFREHRTKVKAPMTLRAEELMIGKLEKIHAEYGHDPTAVIEQSIVNGWRGVFPVKEEENGGNSRNGHGEGDKRTGLARAIDERMGNGRPINP